MIALPRQRAHLGIAAGGRPIRVEPNPRSVRALLRRHLKEEGYRMSVLSTPWQCRVPTVYTIFSDKRPLSPQHIQAAAKFLALDEFDTNELLFAGARESGWVINVRLLLDAESGGPTNGK